MYIRTHFGKLILLLGYLWHGKCSCTKNFSTFWPCRNCGKRKKPTKKGVVGWEREPLTLPRWFFALACQNVEKFFIWERWLCMLFISLFIVKQSSLSPSFAGITPSLKVALYKAGKSHLKLALNISRKKKVFFPKVSWLTKADGSPVLWTKASLIVQDILFEVLDNVLSRNTAEWPQQYILLSKKSDVFSGTQYLVLGRETSDISNWTSSSGNSVQGQIQDFS